MKRHILLSAALLLGLVSAAQTQQGYVKTKGRMVDGRLVPGQGLKGATVSIKGRTAVLVNADDGCFSFPIPEAQFRLDSVRKKGYQLVDLDVLSKTYKHSSNPIYLVMETPEQQLQDQLTAERKIRRTLQRTLQQREDELEALKDAQKITAEEYRQALNELYANQKNNEKLIEEMAKEYAQMDYDQMDDLNRRISDAILNGRLTEADSLLRTKGDINERVVLYRQHEAINAKERAELAERQEQLEQSQALAIQERDDLANDCYRKFEIFKMQHENDSAAYYIELRAGLDTTKINWLFDAGEFFDYLADYNQAISHYHKALQLSISRFGLYTLYNDLGCAYKELADFEDALVCFNKALEIGESIFGAEHTENAITYSNLGGLYRRKEDYGKALEYGRKALSLHLEAFGKNDEHVASDYGNLGVLYEDLGDFSYALECHQKAFDIEKTIFGEDNPEIAIRFYNLASVYKKTGYYKEALEYSG